MNYNSQYHGIPTNKVFRTKRCVRMTKNGREIIKEQGHREREKRQTASGDRPAASVRARQRMNETKWTRSESATSTIRNTIPMAKYDSGERKIPSHFIVTHKHI